ncbi:MAG: hypothetical protein JWP45_1916 [Mucilaginibacter sp.]|nr:hypothetical protein [Mucilaginibacter sp.]MDB5140835.1 hypothetical protein [Mucilaginibacter sp.]
MTESNNILLIVGMHRSGTSVISQWLQKCRLNIGENLLGSGIGNVEGHFEDLDFYRYHEDVLQENHLSTQGYVTRPVKKLSYYQEEKLKALTSFKNKMSEQWGLKEPRTCLFLTHYRKLIPDAHYLVVLRDFHSTVNSLIVRDFKYVEDKYLNRKWLSRQIWNWFRRAGKERKLYRGQAASYLDVWITYNNELLKHMEMLPNEKFIAVDYNSLIKNDKKTFSVLKNEWKFSLVYFEFKKIFKEKFISEVVNIDQFIEDKTLLNRAYELESKLRKYAI